MQTEFNTIAIIGKFMRESAVQLMRKDLVDLAQHLKAKNIEVLFESNTADHAKIEGYKTMPLDALGQKADLVIVMGGDGTMLSAARALKNSDIPLVGINRGHFGFLTDLRAEEMLQSIDAILAGEHQT